MLLAMPMMDEYSVEGTLASMSLHLRLKRVCLYNNVYSMRDRL